MPTSKLAVLTEKDLAKDAKLKKFANPKTHKSKFEKTYGSKKEVLGAVDAWRKSQKPPEPPKPTPIKFKSVLLTPKILDSIRTIHESSVPHVEVVKQGLAPADFFGALHTSMVLMQHMQMKAEYENRKKKAAGNTRQSATVEKAWNTYVQSEVDYFQKNGLSGLTEKDLDNQTKLLAATKSRFNTITNIYNSGTVVQDALVVPNVNEALIEALAEMDNTAPNDTATVGTDLCANPVTQSYTREFSASFALNVRLYVPCPSWSNPFRWCWKTFTVAGASFKMGINITWTLDCHGFAVSGCAYAQACVTVVGIRVCASCEGCVAAAAAVGTVNSSTGNCTYGAGAMAYISCKLAGVTVYYSGVALGLIVDAPCLPA